MAMGGLRPGRRHLFDVPQPGLGPGRVRRRDAPAAGRLLPRPRRHHRPRRRQPPRRLRHGAAHQGAGHARARPVERAGAAARCCTTPSTLADDGPVGDPLPAGSRPAGDRARGRAPGSTPARCRRPTAATCASSPSARCSQRPTRPPTSWRADGIEVHGVGRPQLRRPARPGDARRRRVAHARGHDRGRRPRRRHRHDDRRPAAPLDAPTRSSTCSGCRRKFIPQAKSERILARFGLDAAGLIATVANAERSPCCAPNGCSCAGHGPPTPRRSPPGATIPRSPGTRTG